MPLDRVLADELRALDEAGLRRALRPHASRRGAILHEGGRALVDFASNDYLGLASDPRLARAACAALEQAGTGAGAARLITGHHVLHEQLEAALARFLGVERVLLFSSGYLANTGTIPALVGQGDAIYSDRANHASLIDGCRLSRAEIHIIPHADIAALEQALEQTGGRYRRRLIVVEGIYSMDGDLYPLGALPDLARRHDAWTYVDDAHGIGVLGATGRGAVELSAVRGAIDVWMGTLGKALGTAGAFVAGSATLIEYVMNRARSFVFTTGSPPALAAAALEALEILVREPERRCRVADNARRLRAGIAKLGRSTAGPDTGHIVPFLIGSNDDTMRAGAALRSAGFWAGAVRPPTVPAGTSRLRLTVSSSHTEQQIDALLEALATT